MMTIELLQVSRTTGIIERDFLDVRTNKFFGFLKKGCKEILGLENLIYDWNSQPPGAGWKEGGFYVRHLDRDDMQYLPSQKFVYSVLMHKPATSEDVAEPIGLIYTGNWKTLLLGQSDGYFISRYVKGESFAKIYQRLKPLEKELIFKQIGGIARRLKENQIYLLDFAPRRIMISEKGQPIVLHTKNLKIVGRPDYGEQVRKEQIAQFRKDYHRRLEPSQLDDVVKIVFKY